MRRCAFDKSSAKGVGVGEVGLKMCISMRPLFLFSEERHVIARIVGELVGVAGVKRLGGPRREAS